MLKDRIYAVVDIEATSGSVGTGEKIIQFALVLIKNGKVIESFDTLVNPQRKISKRIKKLTGISQNQLDKAPLFEEIAELIHSLLEDTVFIAHNVAFDYRFLNEQFESVGVDKLTIPAVDTVILSQLLFPQADSYNLKELADYLGYDLQNAHNALSDAEATAFIFNKLVDRAYKLPLITLEKINDFSKNIKFDTAMIFREALNNLKKNPPKLADDLIIIENLAIKKPVELNQPIRSNMANDYPVSNIDKDNRFGSNFKLRPHQEELMDNIYYYFSKSVIDYELAIEAPSGVGKSIGYLYPALYAKKISGPVVVSTYTTILQQQLLEETVPLLNEIVRDPVHAVLVKASRHYLSLNLFLKEMYSAEHSNIEDLFIIQILVWLTETTTGDLGELSTHFTENHYFFDKVGYSDKKIKNFTIPKEVEFFERVLQDAQNADFIITNHAFLINELYNDKNKLPEISQLIIDEAHHLNQTLNQNSVFRLNTKSLRNVLKETSYPDNEDSIAAFLYGLIDRDILAKYWVDTLASTSILLDEQWRDLSGELFELFSHGDTDELGYVDRIIELETLEEYTSTIRKMKQNFDNLQYYLQKIIESIEKYTKEFLPSEQIILTELFDLYFKFVQLSDSFSQIFVASNPDTINWMTYIPRSPKSTLTFKVLTTSKKDELIEKLHRVDRVIYISSTLSVDRSIEFFENQIQNKHIKFLQFLTPYDLKKQSKVIVPNELKPVKNQSNKYYIDNLTEEIETILNQIDRKVLILFHSKFILQKVYDNLVERGNINQGAILAQDISGSKLKILKRFKEAKSGILLGADSFFEGIDLPSELLEIVILTRLPFDSPEMPHVKRVHKRLKERGENIFIEDLLPRAVLRTKQAYGRLIRTENDKGIFIVLDDRFVNANYAKIFQQSLSENLSIDRINLEQVPRIIEEFLN